MAELSQRPRKLAAIASGRNVYGGNGELIAECPGAGPSDLPPRFRTAQETARRIAACLNFCAGFTEEELDAYEGGLVEMQEDFYHPAEVVETTSAGLCDVEELRRLAAAPDVVAGG